MHEMGITQGILSTAIAVAKEKSATRIVEVRISVGELTEVVEDALQFAFESLKRDTIAEDATLAVTHVPALSRCICGAEFEHDRFSITCPECDNFACELIQGRELRIDSIEVD